MWSSSGKIIHKFQQNCYLNRWSNKWYNSFSYRSHHYFIRIACVWRHQPKQPKKVIFLTVILYLLCNLSFGSWIRCGHSSVLTSDSQLYSLSSPTQALDPNHLRSIYCLPTEILQVTNRSIQLKEKIRIEWSFWFYPHNLGCVNKTQLGCPSALTNEDGATYRKTLRDTHMKQATWYTWWLLR